MIVGTGSGFKVMASEEGVPLPHTPLPYTDTFPDKAVGLKLTVIELVVDPVTMVAPVGSDHT